MFFSFAYSDCCMMVFVHFESSFKISFCIAMESLLLSLIKATQFPRFGECHVHCPASFDLSLNFTLATLTQQINAILNNTPGSNTFRFFSIDIEYIYYT